MSFLSVGILSFMMGRVGSVVSGIAAGIFVGALAGLATQWIIVRIRTFEISSRNGLNTTALAVIGAFAFNVWKPLEPFVDVSYFLPYYMVSLLAIFLALNAYLLFKFTRFLVSKT